MGSISIWHWIIVVGYIVIVAVPTARILAKAGFSPWWTALAFVPLINVIAYWVFAFVRWPVEDTIHEDPVGRVR